MSLLLAAGTKRLIAGGFLMAFVVAGTSFAQSRNYPICVDARTDSNGDGFGWENRASCRVAAVTPRSKPNCLSPGSDPDGDGFGWENGRSCVVVAVPSRPDCASSASDPDGDGFGWENGRTCVVQQGQLSEEKFPIIRPACSALKYDPDRDGFGWENSRSCSSFNVGDGGSSITDLILVSGQSNALGAETAIHDPAPYDEDLDSPVRRVYFFTHTGWSIGSLQQLWDLNWYPRGDIAENPANNFAFHFAKNVVLQDAGKVLGVVLVTAPGAPISHWDKDKPFYSSIERKVERALDALPHKSKIDAVLWHQGETDYYASDYYSNKLNQLIRNLRGESWVDWSAPFICGETYNAPVNSSLAALNTDGDSRTACVSSGGLTTVGDGVHFSASSLRVLGSRFASKYMDIVDK